MLLARPRLPPKAALLRALPVVSLLLALLACGWGGMGYGRRATYSSPITHRPAADLRLVAHILGQYSNDQPTVRVTVNVYEGANTRPVYLPPKAHLTCNGSDITLSLSSPRPCPRQSLGGAYHIVFTDEHGASTTLLVAVPRGAFAILSPAAGSNVRIPTNGALEMGFSTPIPSSNGSVFIDTVAAMCATPQSNCAVEESPQQISENVRDALTPTVALGTPQPTATIAMSCAPSTQGPLVTLSEGRGSVIITGDFNGVFQPGSGSVSIQMEACVAPAQTGFNGAIATFMDTVSSPITWTR